VISEDQHDTAVSLKFQDLLKHLVTAGTAVDDVAQKDQRILPGDGDTLEDGLQGDVASMDVPQDKHAISHFWISRMTRPAGSVSRGRSAATSRLR
jgi:hypothetical protein